MSVSVSLSPEYWKTPEARAKEFPDDYGVVKDGVLLIRTQQGKTVVMYGPTAWVKVTGDVMFATD